MNDMENCTNLSGAAMELLQLAARQIEYRDCQRGCIYYDDESGALGCPHLRPRDNGIVCCYGYEESGIDHA